MTNKPKLPSDVNQRAKAIVELATMDEDELRRFREEKAKRSPKAYSKGKDG